MAYEESTGYLIDNIMWAWKVKLVTPITLSVSAQYISKTAGNRLHSNGAPIGNGLWGIKW